MKNKGMRVGALLVCAAMLMCAPVFAEGEVNPFEDYIAENNEFIVVPDSLSADGDIVALDDLNISVVTKNYTAIRQDEGFVYIYFGEDGTLPYTIIGCYDVVMDLYEFADAFTNMMEDNYPDLWVTSEAAPLTLAGTEFVKVQYEYSISGYTSTDTRLFGVWNNRTYMFGAKQVPSLNMIIDDGVLEQIAASMTGLAGGDDDYEKHVDSTRFVLGAGPSLTDLGGMSQNGQSGSGNSGSSTTGSGTAGSPASGSVGGPVGSGGPVGREEQQTDTSDGGIVFDESAANYEGVWVEFTDGFKLYLPDTWNTYVLSDEQRQAGVMYTAGDTSDSDYAPGISVSWGNRGELELEDIAQQLSDAGLEVDELLSVNGITCVSYVNEEVDSCGLLFFHPDGLEYMFAVEAFNYAENVDMLAAVLCSLSLTE